MTSSTASILPPKSVSSLIIKRCVQVYPKLVEKVYAAKIKDAKKLKIALNNEQWRFNELPQELMKSGEDGRLSKEQLERLVQWKITHGVNRPFLPSMIRKNDAAQVSTQTASAFTQLTNTSPTLENTLKALTTACALTGVGPATGSLLLSIWDPKTTPFFQDEMHAWFFPDHAKLKYDRKEYVELWKAVRALLERLNRGVRGEEVVSAVDVEKAAYVLKHADVLGTGEREGLVANEAERGSVGKQATEETVEKNATTLKDEVEEKAATKQEAAKQRAKRPLIAPEAKLEARQPKRKKN